MSRVLNPYRGPRRGPARPCITCGKTHHSGVYDTCVVCGNRKADRPKGHCQICGVPCSGICCLAHRGQRPVRRRGKCSRTMPGQKSCGTKWGPLDHDHCPEHECGRPMAVGQPRCSRCDALLILQTAGTPGVVVTGPAAGANDFHPLRLPSLADELNALDTHGTIEGATESFDDLPEQEERIETTCRCRRPFDLDRCQQRAPYGFIPNGDRLPVACKAFSGTEAVAS